MIQIVIPAAGAGRRFQEAGYTIPKPELPLGDKTMLECVVDNLIPRGPYKVIIVNQKSIPNRTAGAACTVLHTIDMLDLGEPLMIANSDQLVDVDINDFLEDVDNFDGGIMTFRDTDSKWSFVRTNQDGLVMEVAEKTPISDQATVGIYYWKRAGDFVESAQDMIRKDIRLKGEFYVAPTFNELILQGKQIKAFEIPTEAMHGLGTPFDYEHYLATYTNKT